MNSEDRIKEIESSIARRERLRANIVQMLNHRIYMQRGLRTQNEASKMIDKELNALKTVVDIINEDIRTQKEALARF